MFKKLIALKYAVPVAALLVASSAGAVVYNVATNPQVPSDTVQPLTSPGSTEISPTASPDAAGTPTVTATPAATAPAAEQPAAAPATPQPTAAPAMCANPTGQGGSVRCDSAPNLSKNVTCPYGFVSDTAGMPCKAAPTPTPTPGTDPAPTPVSPR